MKFSVLLPTRNRLGLLVQAIESVRRQDYDDWEIVVADNASTDDVPGYVASLNDDRIRCSRSATFLSVTDNWNRALELSEGDYVTMLGDDDALISGYFSCLSELIKRNAGPDALYVEAIQFAYPGVIPGHPKGFVQRSPSDLLEGRTTPFLVDRADALAAVRKSMSLRLSFSYNMQHSLVSRRLIDRMASKGKFFQGPYPDYYASNVLLLEADRLLAVPEPMVVIGITRQSFGFYYFNDRAAEGTRELGTLVPEYIPEDWRPKILPGDPLLSSWFASMACIQQNYSETHGLAVDTTRYRFLQLAYALRHTGIRALAGYWSLLSWHERLSFGARLITVGLVRKLPHGPLRRRYADRFWQRESPWPIVSPPEETVEHRSILELVEATPTPSLDVTAPNLDDPVRALLQS